MMINFFNVRVFFVVATFSFAATAQTNFSPVGYDPHRSFSPDWKLLGGTATRSAQGTPTNAYWQNQANYQLECTLDPVNHLLTGKAIIHYTNNSPYTLDYLWLQLDQHLFNRNSRGQKKLQANANSRYGDPNSSFNGGYTLKSVKQVDHAGKPIGNLVYVETDSRMQIRLERPLATGAAIYMSIDYSYPIAGYGADRSGILQTKNGEIFSMAQFYPRMCVFDDVRGWNTDPYLGAGEFYLEYGNFDVKITAPNNLYVVGGGSLLNAAQVLSSTEFSRWEQARKSPKTLFIRTEKEVTEQTKKQSTSVTNQPQKTWHFSLENARDFAWGASAAFVLDASSISLPSGKTAMALSAYPVESVGSNAWGRSTEYVKGSIENYSNRWFEYPYPVAVNVASNVGGMEYPGIVFCSSSSTGAGLFGVTDHEFGHTWFPMIVGSNERLFGWMDEGFNTFINSLADDDFNQGEYNAPNANGAEMGFMFFQPESESIMHSPDAMRERNIGIALYYKPAFALQVLRKYILGEDRFDFAFRTYIRRWAFKHPTPTDFFRTMEDASGENLHWFWKSWFMENDRLDQGIEKVEFEPEKGTAVTLVNLDKMVMPVLLSYETISGKTGKLEWPAEIWNNTDRFVARIPVQEPLKKITIDPNRAFPDLEYENNGWIAQ
jgi:hypothetical protein